MEVRVEKIYSNKKTSGFKIILQGKTPYFLKVFHHPINLKKVASSSLLLSRPEREFKFSRLLREKGFAVPDVFEFHCRKTLKIFSLNIGYTKSVYLNGLTTLDKHINSEAFRNLLKESVVLLARLHRSGFIHRDISLSNFSLTAFMIF